MARTKKEPIDYGKIMTLAHLLTVKEVSDENKLIVNNLINKELKKEEANG